MGAPTRGYSIQGAVCTPQRERTRKKRLKALSRGPEKTRYYQLGQLVLVTRNWSRAVKPDSPMGKVKATPRDQPTQPLVASYDLQAGSGSILLTPEPTRGSLTVGKNLKIP